jgi:hypothetical protein
MLTLTAPSPDEHMQWVVGWDGRSPRPVCGCQRELSTGLGTWNASASARWNVLRGALRREYPGLEYFRAVERQERGALHLHIIVWSAEPIDLQRVQALALSAGFGCTIDFKPAAPGDTRQAGYVAKYVTKATDERAKVPWDLLDKHTGEVTEADEARYRTWSASRGWGMTMRAIQDGIREAARRRAALLLGQPLPVSEAPDGDPSWSRPVAMLGPD